MDEQPNDAVDIFEDLSYDVKRGLFEDTKNRLRDLPHTTLAELLAEQQRLLFTQQEDTEHEDELVLSESLHYPHIIEICIDSLFFTPVKIYFLASPG